MLKGKKIVIAITGSIAAYKIPLLVRLLIKNGAEVQVVMSPAATDFVTPLTMSTLSLRPVLIEPFKQDTGEWSNHVEIGMWADLMVFAPVTANTLAKLAHGIADNFLVTTYLSAKCPVFIAPAMDLDMFAHPATQENIKILQSYGNVIIEAQTGELASGLSGQGRLEEPEKIFNIISEYFAKQQTLAKKKILITAGPTYEKIDPVRFIGNFSTGTMGFALAEEAASRGAEVILISGPTYLVAKHPGIHRIDVESAEEMLKECELYAADSDMLIMAAAVADYTVAAAQNKKIKKSDEGLALVLKPTIDILKSLSGKRKEGQLYVGFALETDHEIENALKKLKSKNLDFIVLNSLMEPGAGFGTSTNKVTILNNKGVVHHGELKSKRQVACDILDVIA